MGGYLQVLLLVLSNLGTIYKLVELVIKLINRGDDRKKDIADLKVGISEFIHTGKSDTLKGLLCRLEGRCKI